MNELVFPLPVKRCRHKASGKMYKLGKADINVFFAKIAEELSEAMMTIGLFAEDFEEHEGDGLEAISMAEAVNRKAAEEIVDTITACVTTLERMGYDEADRQELYRNVNKKNRSRGYLDEDRAG